MGWLVKSKSERMSKEAVWALFKSQSSSTDVIVTFNTVKWDGSTERHKQFGDLVWKKKLCFVILYIYVSQIVVSDIKFYIDLSDMLDSVTQIKTLELTVKLRQFLVPKCLSCPVLAMQWKCHSESTSSLKKSDSNWKKTYFFKTQTMMQPLSRISSPCLFHFLF
jgi:hypothetical protein